MLVSKDAGSGLGNFDGEETILGKESSQFQKF